MKKIMKALSLALAVLLVAGTASAQSQIGRGLSSAGEPGYSVTLTTSNTDSVYLVGNAFPMSLIGFTKTIGSAFNGNLYACDTSSPDGSFTGCDLVTSLSADVDNLSYMTAKIFFMLEVTTPENVTPGSILVVKGTFDQVSGGSGAGGLEGTLNEMNAYEAAPGQTWVRNDAPDTSVDCSTPLGGGVATNILCMYTSGGQWAEAGLAGGTDNLGSGIGNVSIDISSGANDVIVADGSLVDLRDVSVDGARFDVLTDNVVYAAEYDGICASCGPGGVPLAIEGNPDLGDYIEEAVAVGCIAQGTWKHSCTIVLPAGTHTVDSSIIPWGCIDKYNVVGGPGPQQDSGVSDNLCDVDPDKPTLSGSFMRNVTFRSGALDDGFVQGAGIGPQTPRCSTSLVASMTAGNTGLPILNLHGALNVTIKNICFDLDDDGDGAIGTEPATVGILVTADNSDQSLTKGLSIESVNISGRSSTWANQATWDGTCIQIGNDTEDWSGQSDYITIRDSALRCDTGIVLAGRATGGILLSHNHIEYNTKGVWIENSDATIIGGTWVNNAEANVDPNASSESLAEALACLDAEAAIYIGNTSDSGNAANYPYNVTVLGGRYEIDCGHIVQTAYDTGNTSAMRSTSFQMNGAYLEFGEKCQDLYSEAAAPQTTGSPDNICDADNFTTALGKPGIYYSLVGTFDFAGGVIAARGMDTRYGSESPDWEFFTFDSPSVLNKPLHYSVNSANLNLTSLNNDAKALNLYANANVLRMTNADQIDLTDDYAWTGAHDFSAGTLIAEDDATCTANTQGALCVLNGTDRLFVGGNEITGGTGGSTIINDPIWTAAGEIAYGTGIGAASVLSPTTDGYVLTLAAGLPSWAAGGGGGAGHIIENETAPLPARAALNFTGAGVVCTDNAGNDATDCTIASGGAAGTVNTAGVVHPASSPTNDDFAVGGTNTSAPFYVDASTGNVTVSGDISAATLSAAPSANPAVTMQMITSGVTGGMLLSESGTSGVVGLFADVAGNQTTVALVDGITGRFQVGGDNGSNGIGDGILRILNENGATDNWVDIQASDTGANDYILTLPPDDGGLNQFLQTNGNGILAWATPPGGAPPVHTECHTLFAPDRTVGVDNETVGVVWRAPATATITELWCQTDVGTITAVLGANTVNCTDTGATGTISQPSLFNGETQQLTTSAATGVPRSMVVCQEYTYD